MGNGARVACCRGVPSDASVLVWSGLPDWSERGVVLAPGPLSVKVAMALQIAVVLQAVLLLSIAVVLLGLFVIRRCSALMSHQFSARVWR